MTNEAMCTIHIGLDDFDIGPYGCTTHAATFLLHNLSKRIPVQLIDYPNLVRLNPSIPWKTRGNGAIALRMRVPCPYVDKVVEMVNSVLVEYHGMLAKVAPVNAFANNDSGAVVAVDPLPQFFREVYLQALTDVVVPEILMYKLLRVDKGVYVSNDFGGRGIVGAVAAIGWILHDSDYTYELLTYRQKHRYLEKRCIDIESVKTFDTITSSTTFNNIDVETGRALVISRGFDPVLYGVRGDSVEDLKKALTIIRVCEPITAWTLFRSNQGTDAHAIDRRIEDLRAYRTARLILRIVAKPVVLPGGHVIVRGSDATGVVDLVFFKPSGLANIAQNLCIGDEILVQGHVKPWRGNNYFHVEKMAILKLMKRCVCRTPRCPRCYKRMVKKGFGKGYRCPTCGYRSSTPELECLDLESLIPLGLYVPPASEQKHLIKPLKRYGREKTKHPYPNLLRLEDVSGILDPLGFL